MHNFSPVLKFIHYTIIYDFGGGKGAAPPCLRKFCIGLNLHNFRPFLV